MVLHMSEMFKSPAPINFPNNLDIVRINTKKCGYFEDITNKETSRSRRNTPKSVRSSNLNSPRGLSPRALSPRGILNDPLKLEEQINCLTEKLKESEILILNCQS